MPDHNRYTKPRPDEVALDGLDTPFWEAAAKHKFVLHKCAVCNTFYWPSSLCTTHGDTAMVWTEAGGRGKLHTYTILHRTLHPGFETDIPYNVAVVETEEGPFVFSNIVGCRNEDLRIGMSLEVTFDDVAPGLSIPKFKPSARK
ncbi:MAG: hypothetical protein FJ039_04780 [Chloroflexi bacterium]|nr:hypothetical protein [Chloroflexota bacterium]